MNEKYQKSIKGVLVCLYKRVMRIASDIAGCTIDLQRQSRSVIVVTAVVVVTALHCFRC